MQWESTFLLPPSVPPIASTLWFLCFCHFPHRGYRENVPTWPCIPGLIAEFFHIIVWFGDHTWWNSWGACGAGDGIWELLHVSKPLELLPQPCTSFLIFPVTPEVETVTVYRGHQSAKGTFLSSHGHKWSSQISSQAPVLGSTRKPSMILPAAFLFFCWITKTELILKWRSWNLWKKFSQGIFEEKRKPFPYSSFVSPMTSSGLVLTLLCFRPQDEVETAH